MSPSVMRAMTLRRWERSKLEHGAEHTATLATAGRMAAAWSVDRTCLDHAEIISSAAQVAYARATLHPGFLNRHRRRRLQS